MFCKFKIILQDFYSLKLNLESHWFCFAGGGIYFATTPEDANRKAKNHGALLTCRVNLGNLKTISEDGDTSLTFSKLLNEGYDSVLIRRVRGVEYVVYNYDQVQILEVEDVDTGEILFNVRDDDDRTQQSFRRRSRSSGAIASRGKLNILCNLWYWFQYKLNSTAVSFFCFLINYKKCHRILVDCTLQFYNYTFVYDFSIFE